LVIDENVI